MWGSEGSGNGQFQHPRGIGTDATGNVYVADQNNHRIQKFGRVWTITASAGANGSIAPSGAVSVPNGADQTFTITPDTGYHVATLTVDGSPVTPPVTGYTFTNVTANHTIAASFAEDTPSNVEEGAIPAKTFLGRSYPNPTQGTTTIAIGLHQAGHVRMRVFDVSGRLVRDLVDREEAAGMKQVVWDGRSNAGRSVSSGMYLMRMETAGEVFTRCLQIVR
jgi:hypothetical protein